MNLRSLCSGSSGNAFLIDAGGGPVLLDIGLSYRMLKEELAEAGTAPEEIKAVLLTHEHADHVSGLPAFMKNCPGVPVYASYGTYDGLSREKIFARLRLGDFSLIRPHEHFTAAGIGFTALPTLHDTADSLAYRGCAEGKSFAVVTDLGCWTEELAGELEGLSVLCLEANHDLRMLETGRYPYPLKLRIGSERGHLSNDDAARLLVRLWHPGLKEVLLAHLSEENNLPILAVQTMISELSTSGIDPDTLTISAAPRKGMSHPICF